MRLYEHMNRIEMVFKHYSLTSSWRIMSFFRRIKIDLINGNNKSRKSFLKWGLLKVTKREIPKALSLDYYSPHHEIINMIRYELRDYEACCGNDSSESKINEWVYHPSHKSVDIFRFPVIDWNYRHQRPQQMMLDMAQRGYRIFYICTETNTVEDDSVETLEKNMILDVVAKNIYSVKLCSKNRIDIYKDGLVDEDREYLLKSLKYLKNKFQVFSSLSIIDLPFWYPLVSRLKNNHYFYDCMDEHAGFHNNHDDMLNQEAELILNAEKVIVSSKALYEKVALLRASDSILLIRNGCEYDHFSDIDKNWDGKNTTSVKPVIGYYGAISTWFDVELVAGLARHNPEWNFVLIGAVHSVDVRALRQCENISLLGEKHYIDLPSFVADFDVCIIPFIRNSLTEATNPVKVYEYLAAGKPVVSVSLPELIELGGQGLVYLADDLLTFQKKIAEAISEDSIEKKTMRQTYAKNNTWAARGEMLDDAIQLFSHNKKYDEKVSIVIVTYNNWLLSQNCLRSVLENTDEYEIEVIVVDNCSTDETRLELARINDSRMQIHYMKENLGFAKGNNFGIKQASGDYVILLNNDTIVPNGWLHRIISKFTDEKIGMVGPMSNSVGNEQIVDFYVPDERNGVALDYLNLHYHFNDGNSCETEMLGFFCVAIRYKVIDKVGLLDENFGIGMFEDDDYCYRVRQADYKLLIAEDAFVFHKGSAAFKKIDDNKYMNLWDKNKKYFQEKHGVVWTQSSKSLNFFLENNLMVGKNDSFKFIDIAEDNYPRDMDDANEKFLMKKSHLADYLNASLINCGYEKRIYRLSNKVYILEDDFVEVG